MQQNIYFNLKDVCKGLEKKKKVKEDNEKNAALTNMNNNIQCACCLKVVKYVQKGT